MKSFRRLCLAIALMAVFAMPALAEGEGGDTQGPSIDGETNSPPAPGDGHGTGLSLTGDGQCPTLMLSVDARSSTWTVIILAMQDLLF